MLLNRSPWRIRSTLSAVAVLGSLSYACSSSPAAPEATIQLRIAPQPDVVVIGATVPLTATNASTGALMSVTWSTSNPSVALVTGGILQPRSAGRVTVTAAYGRSRQSFSVKVVPNFAGDYPPAPLVGTLYKVGCVDLTPGVLYCSSNYLDEQPWRFVVTQDKDQVTLKIVFGVGGGGVLTGSIDDVGQMHVAGTMPSGPGHGGYSFQATRIASWATYLDSTGAMFGSLSWDQLDPWGTVLFRPMWEMRGIPHGPAAASTASTLLPH